MLEEEALGVEETSLVLSLPQNLPTVDGSQGYKPHLRKPYELINYPLQLPHGLMYHSHNILTVDEEKIGVRSQFGKLDELDEGRHPYQEKEPLKPFPDNTNPATGEVGGPKGPEPTRYGDWERKGRVSDF
uniref:Succinate dehydrogenase assembly factor 4, mitochondrial n=1 Tax=Timema douglasi TaxID=61478 RepID=A0A7R8VF40_TIMDO|nr:unnamed protein product [Timema douglasi]